MDEERKPKGRLRVISPLFRWRERVTSTFKLTVITSLVMGTYLVQARAEQSNKSSESSKERPSAEEPMSRVRLSASYLRGRGDLSSSSYATSHGASFDSSFRFYRRAALSLEGVLSYRGASYIQTITPSASELQQNLMSAEGGELGLGSQQSALNRPAEVSASLGSAHIVNFGIQVKIEKKRLSERVASASLKFGARWSKHQREALTLGDQNVMSVSEEQAHMWGCAMVSLSSLWISVSYLGDPCIGHRQALLRSLFGLTFGRAQIGVGWGAATTALSAAFIQRGGPMAWVSLPMSAPLYLEMSVMRLSGVKHDPLFIAQVDEGKTSDHLMVGIRWTGEQRSEELAPTAPKKGLTPKAPPGSTPSYFNPQTPLSPRLNPQRPSSTPPPL